MARRFLGGLGPAIRAATERDSAAGIRIAMPPLLVPTGPLALGQDGLAPGFFPAP
jgi:hypothetical protein